MTATTTTAPRRGPLARLVRQPRPVLIVAGIVSVLCAAGGVIGGRVAAPHAADPSVDVAPLTAPPSGEPIVRPETLELPR